VSPEEIKDVQLRMGAGVAMMDEPMTLPETFMWTKMGWESGVRLADILRQKEVERQAQGGLFLRGIGTTLSAERLRALRERVQVPHVVFTKMVSGSKPIDYEPDNLERAGVPRSTAMKMVGHKTETIYRRYAIADEGMLRAGGVKLEALHQADQPAERTVIPIGEAPKRA